MQQQEPDYPTEYRGNTIYDERSVSELSDDLRLVQGGYEIDRICDRIGVEYDRDSILLEDSYNCLWVNTENDEYTEVWGIHKVVPYNHLIAVRLK